MKTRYSNKELPHIWAAQSQDHASANSMFFESNTIYSYGKHFPIARILPGGVVLFTSKSYSVTTAKHKSRTRQAISSRFTVFTVPCVMAESEIQHGENVAALLSEYKENHGKALRALTNAESYARAAKENAEDALAYCKAFKITGEARKQASKAAKRPFTVSEEKLLAGKIERSKIAQEAREKREEARRAAAAKELLPDLQAWAEGHGPHKHGFYGLPVRLRVVAAESGRKIVETSHGATVFLLEAVELLGDWQASTVEPGQKIGPYTVESVTPDVIKIGCHTISREEAEKVIVPAAQIR